MPEKKNWGSTVVGWFIVPENRPEAAESSEPSPAEDDLIRRAAEEDAGALPVFAADPPAASGGQVDFNGVFEAAGITEEEHQRVTRTLELLNSLPPGTDDAVKRQIVMASLRAFSVPIEAIIESGVQELEALEAYIRGGARDAEKVTSEGELQIRRLEEEINGLRKAMQQRVEEQRKVMQACNAKKLEVQKVLEFFGQDAVARVVHDSPKLHEPKSGN